MKANTFLFVIACVIDSAIFITPIAVKQLTPMDVGRDAPIDCRCNGEATGGGCVCTDAGGCLCADPLAPSSACGQCEGGPLLPPECPCEDSLGGCRCERTKPKLCACGVQRTGFCRCVLR